MKPKEHLILFCAIFIYAVISGLTPLSASNLPILSKDHIMILQQVLFAFGWSSTIDVWSINNESVLLNNRALVIPPATPISEDAGPPQLNPSQFYINNIAFGFMWSKFEGERYRPSTSMLVGEKVNVNGRGMVKVPDEATSGDAGPHQLNIAITYLNKH